MAAAGISLRSLGRQLRRPVGLSLFGSATIQVLGLLTGILLARELGPAGRGELAAVILWPMLLLAVGSIGVNESLSYHLARRPSSASHLIGTGLLLALVQGLALVAVGLIVIPLALSRYDPDVVDSCLLFLTMIPVGLAGLYLSWVLNGAHRFGWFNFMRVFVVATAAAGLIGLALADDLTVRSAVFAYLAAQLLTLLAAAIAVRGLVGRAGRASRDLAREVLGFGWRSQLSTLSNLLNERLDQLVISIFLPAADLGVYVVAWTISVVTSLFGSSVAMVALPKLAGSDDVEMSRLAARRYVSLTAVTSLAGAVVLIIATPFVVRFVFGDRFDEAIGIARVLILASVALGVARAVESVLKGVNRPLDAGIAELVGLAVTAVGLATLLPTLGLTGAAITSTVAYSATAAFALRRANAALGTRGLELLLPVRRQPPIPYSQDE